ncbi:hypothetical protein BOM_1108 (plasmid) [Borrelia miyamotoi FR64b]|uniref:Uncharacterized protein n=1 Tax=Borrelia miyamotoi FR64b TaxID=1292392 RepID=W5SKM2_9SPIR|nr:hypothetical protein BOM_1108 [Borrelia miyamotoi FR64b]
MPPCFFTLINNDKMVKTLLDKIKEGKLLSQRKVFPLYDFII